MTNPFRAADQADSPTADLAQPGTDLVKSSAEAGAAPSLATATRPLNASQTPDVKSAQAMGPSRTRDKHQAAGPTQSHAAHHQAGHNEVLRIRARGRWAPLNFREIWQYRELMWFLVWRDVKVRYKQTALGVAWAVLQPLMSMLVFTLVFARIAHVGSEGVPYPLFAYCALLPWQLFAFSLTESSMSVVANERLISKIYFPRILVPIAAACAGLVDMAVSFLVLMALFAYYGVRPSAAMALLPLFVALALATALAVGIWLAALNVQYRDVRYVLPFITQFWLFATPVAYPVSLVPARWRVLYGLNPMTGVVEGFRWSLLGRGDAPGLLVAISCGMVLLLLIGGLYYFRSVERTFADVV